MITQLEAFNQLKRLVPNKKYYCASISKNLEPPIIYYLEYEEQNGCRVKVSADSFEEALHKIHKLYLETEAV